MDNAVSMCNQQKGNDTGKLRENPCHKHSKCHPKRAIAEIEA
jgi:hypothetical protein